VGIQRARSAGSGRVANIRFEEGDPLGYEPTATFDALIRRFVLLYFPGPAATLRGLSRLLRPGGLLAFQEHDMPSSRPSSALYNSSARKRGQ
jgi:SAM-dependent methyltransferase